MSSFDPEEWADPDVEADSESDALLELEVASKGVPVNVHSSLDLEEVTTLVSTFRGYPSDSCSWWCCCSTCGNVC